MLVVKAGTTMHWVVWDDAAWTRSNLGPAFVAHDDDWQLQQQAGAASQHNLYAVLALQGERSLGFVLENQGMIDKTLLFDIDLIRVQK
jgi:hypothetical protein